MKEDHKTSPTDINKHKTMKQITVTTKYSPTEGWEASSEQVPGCVAYDLSPVLAMVEFVEAYTAVLEARIALGKEPRAMNTEWSELELPEKKGKEFTCMDRTLMVAEDQHEKVRHIFAETDILEDVVTWELRSRRKRLEEPVPQ